MIAGFFADLVLLVHFALVLFAIFGGLCLFWRRSLLWLHLPYLVWAALVNLVPIPCPLTPLENDLREAAGHAGYTDGFIAHYVVQLVYPAGMTRPLELAAGIGVVVWNAMVYAGVFYRLRRLADRERELAPTPERSS